MQNLVVLLFTKEAYESQLMFLLSYMNLSWTSLARLTHLFDLEMKSQRGDLIQDILVELSNHNERQVNYLSHGLRDSYLSLSSDNIFAEILSSFVTWIANFVARANFWILLLHWLSVLCFTETKREGAHFLSWWRRHEKRAVTSGTNISMLCCSCFWRPLVTMTYVISDSFLRICCKSFSEVNIS